MFELHRGRVAAQIMLSLHRVATGLGRAKAVDPLAGALDLVGRPLRSAPAVKDALNGTWLEHPLHPLMVALPIGAWVAGSVFDLLGKTHRATADNLVAFGAAAAVPTAAAGLAQWVDASQPARRIGAVHAAANTVTLVLQVASLRARRKGWRARGVVLSQAAMGSMAAAGYLGGHLSYALGYGVDHTAFETRLTSWTSTGIRDSEVGERQLIGAAVRGERVLLTRLGGQLRAFAERCSHEAGPLSEGSIVGDGADACVECPWHGSRFSLDDGSVKRSPATVPARAYETRVAGEIVEVRLSEE